VDLKKRKQFFIWLVLRAMRGFLSSSTSFLWSQVFTG
jgi:hypothetical protein